MVTVVTHVVIKDGEEPRWDAGFRERVEAARQQAGWLSVQLCIPLGAMNERVVIGTWETRADWEAWHATEAFQETREAMDASEAQRRGEWWHEVVIDERR
jgi:heme-degrading monooxygenase HmoA